MKIIIISLISLSVGIGIGWCFGYTRPIAEADRDARQEMLAMQNDDCKAAIVAVRAVFLLDSGNTQKAVEWLSDPISRYYYCFYALNAGTNEERLKMRAVIEQLAHTNQVVAASISNKMAYNKNIQDEIDKVLKEK
jgi:hypothetical protein